MKYYQDVSSQSVDRNEVAGVFLAFSVSAFQCRKERNEKKQDGNFQTR